MIQDFTFSLLSFFCQHYSFRCQQKKPTKTDLKEKRKKESDPNGENDNFNPILLLFFLLHSS